MLKELKPETVVGVVDIKDNEVESTDVIAKRIENAVNVLGMERISGVHPDGVFGCCRVVWPTEKWPL